MNKHYDVVVIGSGVAGKAAASGLASAGKNVAVIENDLWGGTCPNRGCDPKKVLLSAVEAKTLAEQLTGKGINDVPTVNWPDLMAFKNTFTDPVPKQSRESLESAGAELYSGTAEFVNETSLEVNGDILSADRFIIATGAHPSILDIKGKEHFQTSDDFLSLAEMPESLAFIGGGYIAFEFAGIAAAAGAKVHIIQHNTSPLKAYDQDLVKTVMKQLETKGVTFHLDTNVTEISKKSDSYLLTGDGDFSLRTALVFGTTGRVPSIDKLNLEKAGVAYDKKGIQVNDHLQTSNPHVYALGDVLSKDQPKLTPVSSLEASYIISLLTDEQDGPIDYPSIPTIVFTRPKLAQVGVTKGEAEAQKDTYDLSEIDATSWFSYSRTNEPIAKAQIITDKKTGRLVGASCLNNEADELINYFSILINKEIKAEELRDITFAYPTIASDLSYFYK